MSKLKPNQQTVVFTGDDFKAINQAAGKVSDMIRFPINDEAFIRVAVRFLANGINSGDQQAIDFFNYCNNGGK